MILHMWALTGHAGSVQEQAVSFRYRGNTDEHVPAMIQSVLRHIVLGGGRAAAAGRG